MAPRKDDILPFLIGMLLGGLVWFFFVSSAHAADLSTDPMDADSSAPPEVFASDDEDSEEESTAPDIIFEEPDQAEINTEPDVYSESEDVVVSRADLQEVVDLLNDLSTQLSLYASEVPAGYEPTEADLEYRASLLETLSGIHDSLMVLTEPPIDEAQEEPMEEATAEDQAEAETSAPADTSSTADASAPAETDPADSPATSTDISADSSMEDNTISEQVFFKLVLALLLVLVSIPFISWAYKFISSFFPV